MTDLTKIREYVAANQDRYIDLLKQACSIPSVSAEGSGFEEMTGWLEEKLHDLGATVTHLQVGDSPEALLAEIKGSSSKRTLMIYDHYDVQPVD
ncbi:MAG: hypothetical protein LC723_13260, partial [Actinobacteria bacterium]|nr:hypothetical protein [Actinomycetota bacterium]